MTLPGLDGVDRGALLRTLAAVAVLLGLTIAVLVALRAPRPAVPLLAIGRAVVQLAAVSVVLSGIISDPRWVAVALGVMVVVAVGTATRRIGAGRAAIAPVALAIVAGTAVALTAIFVSGALEPTGRYLLAMGGIVIGNAMAISGVTGRRLRDGVRERWDEVEGWLALGARPRQATRDMGRQSIGLALAPTLDQTATTGLVALPGAFVGAIFGGLSPVEAARFQILVLTGVIAAGAVAAAVIVLSLGAVRQRPEAGN
ncbi:MAG: ABC transporter permease [Actinomycetales bacterium]|nr:ABC transporter permease [Actinomycetales bacterium]